MLVKFLGHKVNGINYNTIQDWLKGQTREITKEEYEYVKTVFGDNCFQIISQDKIAEESLDKMVRKQYRKKATC